MLMQERKMAVETSFVYRWCGVSARAVKQHSPVFWVCLPYYNDSPWEHASCRLHLEKNLVGLHSPPFMGKCTFRAIDGAGKTLAVAEVQSARENQYRCIQTQFFNSDFKQGCASFSVEVRARIFFSPQSISEVKIDIAHLSSVSTATPFESLLNDKLFADVTIKCGDESFGGHKAILASRSPVFRKMFEADMKEKSSNVIEIVDMDPPVMSDLLAYLYTETAPNLKETAKQLLNAANKYEIPELYRLCELQLGAELTAANVANTLILADLHSASYLKEACFYFIRKNKDILNTSDEWRHFFHNCDHLLLHEIFMALAAWNK